MNPIQDAPFNELHRRYLLGDLSEEEQDRLEQRLLEDPHLFEQVEAVEDELVDRYVRHELKGREVQRFEERLLSSPRVRGRVKTAQALRRMVSAASERGNGLENERSNDPRPPRLLPLGPGKGGQSRRPQFGSPWLAWAACLVTLIAAGVFALTSLRLQDRLDRVQEAHRIEAERARSAEERAAELESTLDRSRIRQTEVERLRRNLADRDQRIVALEESIEQASRELAKTPSASEDRSADIGAKERTVLFLSFVTRGNEEPARLVLPPEGETVELQLGLDRIRPEGELSVSVRRAGALVFRQSGVSPVFAGPEAMIRVTVPSESLRPGRYQLEVTERTPGGVEALGLYGLVVVD